MRILYLSQSRLPSSSANSVHVMKMCQALSELGNKVTLCGYRGNDNNLLEYYNCPDSFNIVRFSIRERAGESVLLALSIAIWLLRHRQFDLVYSRSAVCLVASLLFGIPFVYEIHSAPRTRVHRLLETLIFRSKLHRKTVFISRALQTHYESIFTSEHKAPSIVLADAANEFQPVSQKINLPGHSIKKIGYLGHLYPGKGGENIIQIATRMPDVDFHLIGGRPQDIERLRSLGATENVYFHGHIAHAETSSYLESIEIFLAPYSTRVNLANTRVDVGQWMSPLKLFEYMAAGKVIICSDLPVLKEIMINEKNCLLAETDSVMSWKKQISRALSETRLRERLSANALHDFQTHYTWKQRAKRLCDAI